MKNKLPVELENLELPKDEYKKDNDEESMGYASVLFLLSLIVISWSVVTILLFRR